MQTIRHLVRAEMFRLNKYNLLKASFVVNLIWLIFIYFLKIEELKQFLPIIILMDASLMTALLNGVTLFYEKKENTLSSILVSPVKVDQYLIAKIIVNVMNSLLWTGFFVISVYFLKGMTYNYLLIFLAVVVISSLHTLIGIWFSYFSKDFTTLLINYMIYTLISSIPIIMGALNVFSDTASKFLFFIPLDTANKLMNYGMDNGDLELLGYIVGLGYLTLLTVLLYIFKVKKDFQKYATKEVGV